MILRILLLFSSPFSSWQIPLCRPNRYPTINAMTHGPFVTIKSYTLGASDIKWPVSSSRQWWCPTLWEYHPSLCASHPARKISGIPGKFPWAALEAQENCPGIPWNLRAGWPKENYGWYAKSIGHSRSLAFARIYWAQLRKLIFIGPQLQWTWQ